MVGRHKGVRGYFPPVPSAQLKLKFAPTGESESSTDITTLVTQGSDAVGVCSQVLQHRSISNGTDLGSFGS